MTTAIKQLLSFSWMSQASYLDFSGLLQNSSADIVKGYLTNPNRINADNIFSSTQATFFTDPSNGYSFVSYMPNDAAGFSAAVFKVNGAANDYTIAVRGTESTPWSQTVSDLLNTDALSVGLQGAAYEQSISAYRYYKQLTTARDQQVSYSDAELARLQAIFRAEHPSFMLAPEADVELAVSQFLTSLTNVSDPNNWGTGAIDATTANIHFTGHSLGGHVATLLASMVQEFGQGNVADVMTYNSPGQGGLLSASTLIDATAIASKITNMIGEGGLVTFTPTMGTVSGNFKPISIFIETNLVNPIDNHSIVKLSDSLAVYNLFAKLDPSFNTATPADGIAKITDILKASSNVVANSLESAVSALGKLFTVPSAVVTGSAFNGTGRDLLYKALNDISAAVNNRTYTISDLTTLSADQIASAAQSNLAYRYALVNLNSFAVAGANYSSFDSNGQLDLYNPSTKQGSLSPQYLQDRAAMLKVLMDRNTQDATVAPYPASAYYSDTASDIVLRPASAGHVGDNALQHISFGADKAVLTGGFLDDRLYAGTGSETLRGGAGSDSYNIEANQSNVNDTINDSDGKGSVWVGGSQLTSITPVAGKGYTWTDANNTQYSYDPTSKKLNITGGQLVGSGETITIDHFDINAAQSADGYLGIRFPKQVSVAAGALDPFRTGAYSITDQAAAVLQGALQTFTVAVSAISDTIQTLTLKLSNAATSTWKLVNGADTLDFAADGTVQITIPAGQDSVTLALVDGSNSNMADGAKLTATLSDASSTITSNELAVTFANPNPFAGGITAPIIPDNIINGDLKPVLDANGQAQYDAQGKLITEADPDRNDALYGTAANDLINAGSGADTIYASQGGNDTIVGGNGYDYIEAGSGNNLINAGDGFNWELAGDGNNTITGGSSIDIISVGDGNNLIVGKGNSVAPSTAMAGLADVIIAGNGSNQIYANTQVDLATSLAQQKTAVASGQKGAFISVGDGNNTIVGGSGNDAIFTGTGNNTIVTGPGAVTVVGGVEVNSAQLVWSEVNNLFSGVSAASAPFSPIGPYNGNTFNGVPVGMGNDTIFGGTGNSTYFLSNGNNWLDAGGGNDMIYAGVGNNTIFGGTGNDTIYGGGGNNYINLETGNDLVAAEGGNQTIIGGSGNDTIYSGANTAGWATSEATASNYIYGGSGNTVIYGSGGNDTLISGSASGTGQASTIHAGDGTEYIVGGNGNDTLYGGAGVDTIYAGDGNNTVVLSSKANETSTVYGGSGADTIRGGAGTDVIYAGDGGTLAAATQVYSGTGNSTIYGGAGVEKLYGSSGTTRFIAGSGNETITGGTGGDNTYEFDAGFGNVQLNASPWGRNNVVFGSGVSLSDLTLSTGPNNDLVITDISGGSVTIAGGMDYAVDSFTFSDSGQTFYPQDLFANARWGAPQQADVTALESQYLAQQQTNFTDSAARSGYVQQADGSWYSAPQMSSYYYPRVYLDNINQTFTYSTSSGTSNTIVSNISGYWQYQGGVSVTDAISTYQQLPTITLSDSNFYQSTAGTHYDYNYNFPNQTGLEVKWAVDQQWAKFYSGSPWWTWYQVSGYMYPDGSFSFSNGAGAVSATGFVKQEHTTVAYDPTPLNSDLQSSLTSIPTNFTWGGYGTLPQVIPVDRYRFQESMSTEQIDITSGNNTVYGGTVVNVQGNGNVVDGADLVYNASGNNTIQNALSVYIASGDNTLFDDRTVYAGSGNDTITGCSTVYGGSGNDVIDGSETVYFGSGNDTITNSWQVYAGSGNDLLFGDRMVLAGGGNDTILSGSGDNNWYNTTDTTINPDTVGNVLVGGIANIGYDVLDAFYQSQGISDWYWRYTSSDAYSDPLPILAIVNGNWIQPSNYYAQAGVPVAKTFTANDYGSLSPYYAQILSSYAPGNTVTFEQGVAVSDLQFSWGQVTTSMSGSPTDPQSKYTTLNLTWGTDNQSVQVIIPHADEPVGSGVSEFIFADGTKLSMADLIAMAPPAPTFDPQISSFMFGAAMGAQTLPVATTTIQFAAGIDPSAITVTSTDQGDFIVSYNNGASTLVIPAQATMSTPVMASFEGGSNWQFVNAAGNAYTYSAGGGVVYLSNPSSIQFGAGITSSMISLGLGSLMLNIGSTGDAIHIEGFNPRDALNSTSIQNLQFADGTTLSYNDLLSRGFDIYGTAGNDTLSGTNLDNRIYGGAGNDLLIGSGANDMLYGGTGNDTLQAGYGKKTFVLNQGDGQDTIVNANMNTIQFGSGISIGTMWLKQQGGNLAVNYDTQGDSILLQDFVSVGQSTASFKFADGSNGVYQNSGGRISITAYDAGQIVGNTWSNSDGSRGKQFFNANGTSSGTSYNADGSYSSYTNDGFGKVTTNYFSASGDFLSYSIAVGDGHGNNTATNFDPSGNVLGSTISTNDGLGNTNTTNYDASGIKLSDRWTQANGTTGSDTFISDGSVESKVTYTYADGSTYSTDTVSDPNGSYQQTWSKSDGSAGSTNYNAVTGEVIGNNATAGAGYSYTYDNILLGSGVTESKVTYTYSDGSTYSTDTISDPNGSYQQTWTKSDSRSGSTSYNAVTGEVIGSNATAGAGYSYTYDNTQNVGGVSGVTESKVNYSYSDGTTYATDTVSDPNGSYQQTWSKSDGSTGSTNYDAVTGEVTGSNATVGAGYSYIYDNTLLGSGVTESKVNYLYADGSSYATDTVSDPNGSYQQAWSKSDGSTGSTNYDSMTGEVTGSNATAGAGYSYTYDNTQNVGGISGVTESKVNYTYADGSTYATDTTSNPDGSYFQSWSKSDGTAGSSTVNATGTLTGDSWAHADGSQGVDALSNHLIMSGSGNDALTAQPGNDLLIGGTGNDAITTGAGTNIIAFDAGDGNDNVYATSGQNNVLSLGGHFAYSDLSLQRNGSDLILDVGASDSITFKDWYAGNQNIVDLQVIASAMSDFNPGSTDVLRNSQVETFDFKSLVSAFDLASANNPSLSAWGVTNALLDAHLSSSDTAALGGDLAFEYGARCSLSGFGVPAAQSTLSSSQFATAPQTLNAWPTLDSGAAQIK